MAQRPSFKGAVAVTVVGKILGDAMTTPAKKATAKGSVAGEVEVEAKLPLIAAINALGGAKVLLAAIELQLVVSKFPKGDAKTPSNENRFVQGLQGRISEAITTKVPDSESRVYPKSEKPVPTINIKMSKGDLFRIRWDFVPGEAKDTVPGKGLHINAEFGIGATNTSKNKIAFMPTGVTSKIPSIVQNPDRFDQIVRDQSTFLGYNIKPNTLQKVFTVEERLHQSSPATAPPAKAGTATATAEPGRKPTAAELEKVMTQAARRLAERWAAIVSEGTEPELT